MQVRESSRIILYVMPFEKVPGAPDELIFGTCKDRAMRRTYTLGREGWPFPSIRWTPLPNPSPQGERE